MNLRSRAPARRMLLLAACAAALTVATTAAAQLYGAGDRRWWSPGEDRILPRTSDHGNEYGTLRTLNVAGDLPVKDHPFFTALGTNGRACVTCHQPADAMSLSVATIRDRWQRTEGNDPLFAAIDGSNCPNLPQRKLGSHSLLLDHGLIRVQRPWPPRDESGAAIKPDFAIEVVRDPTGCNSNDPRSPYGLRAREPNLSVYRRPRPVANLKYLLAMGFAYDPKSGMPLRIDPETGKPASGNLMADARVLNLAAQARDAMRSHLEVRGPIDEAVVQRIVEFESGLFSAQQVDRAANPLNDGGAYGGPKHLADSMPGQLGSQGTVVWSEFKAWETISETSLTPAQRELRVSIARGAKVFRDKMFLISDSAGINSPIGFGNPVRNSCVFCHNMSQMGNDVAPGQVDLGTQNAPFADPAPHLPLFKITCKAESHPHYGKTIYSYDPGYALTTGKCADVGKITLQSNRGLAARAPYFANGSARTLRDVVDYYDRRYNIGYTEQEKQDLVNLMGAL
jgi:hypothetical protein